MGVANLSSPYDPDAQTMPANTLCTTAHRCVDWNAGTLSETQTLWRKLRVFCDGGDDDYTGGVLGDDGSGAILEHLCVGGDTAPTLVVDLGAAGNGVGADLVCDVEGTMNGNEYTIAAPNHCLLLCDLHIGMTINGKLEENGEYVFRDQDDNKITAAEVICWQGKRI